MKKLTRTYIYFSQEEAIKESPKENTSLIIGVDTPNIIFPKKQKSKYNMNETKLQRLEKIKKPTTTLQDYV